jgi:hypothetical protein
MFISPPTAADTRPGRKPTSSDRAPPKEVARVRGSRSHHPTARRARPRLHRVRGAGRLRRDLHARWTCLPPRCLHRRPDRRAERNPAAHRRPPWGRVVRPEPGAEPTTNSSLRSGRPNLHTGFPTPRCTYARAATSWRTCIGARSWKLCGLDEIPWYITALLPHGNSLMGHRTGRHRARSWRRCAELVSRPGTQRRFSAMTELFESCVAQSSPALLFADDRGREGA